MVPLPVMCGSWRDQFARALTWPNRSAISLRQNGCSFDHLVGEREQRRRHCEAAGSGGLEVDDQLDFSGLLDRQVGGFLAFENSSGVNADLTIVIRLTGSVAQQAAGRGERAILMDRGHRVAERQCGELFASGREE